jgi:hypothetical protein
MESAAAKLRGDALVADLGFSPAGESLVRLGALPLSYVARRGSPDALGFSRKPTPSANPTDPRDSTRAKTVG